MPLRLAIVHLDVVVEREASHDHLDLERSEEATGARVPAVAKGKGFLVGGDELVAGDICGLADRARLVESEAVEDLRIRVELVVAVDGLGRNFDHDARGNVLAVAESYVLEHAAEHTSCWERKTLVAVLLLVSNKKDSWDLRARFSFKLAETRTVESENLLHEAV